MAKRSVHRRWTRDEVVTMIRATVCLRDNVASILAFEIHAVSQLLPSERAGRHRLAVRRTPLRSPIRHSERSDAAANRDQAANDEPLLRHQLILAGDPDGLRLGAHLVPGPGRKREETRGSEGK
jgi:hypothetical protein